MLVLTSAPLPPPIQTAPKQIETPLQPFTGAVLGSSIAIVPILRAGLGLLDPLLGLMPDAHVHVMIFVGFGQYGTHVAVFNRISTAAAEMAVHAAGGPAGSADICSDLDQVHIFGREPCCRRRFLIFPGGVMANQTIDFAHVVEIKICILPPVADMAACTAGPVSVQVDTEIIDGEIGAKDGLYRPNIVLTLDSNSDVTLLLESHLDVVPAGPNWTYNPYNLTIKDGKAYGRGSADNKSAIAAAMGALRILRKNELDINISFYGVFYDVCFRILWFIEGQIW